ncbi:MAG: hypothetical protein Q7J54_01780 [Candidatus Woesearchaeota archaeon]|nr:hypothetical protein [Candidatus Woesearchaeota archaeon]
MKSEEDLFYIGIKEPTSMRREILETSKLIVQLLQRYENFRLLKAEKTGEIVKLRSAVNDINSLFFKLRAELPKTKLRSKVPEEEAEEKPKKEKRSKKDIKVPAEKTKKSSVDELEDQLKEIEARLGNLS